MFSTLETLLINSARSLPLDVFVFIASFIEEVLAPIPSAGVLLITGSIALIQERPLLALIPLTLIAALGKTLGALLVYFIAQKIGDLTIIRFGRFFGVTPTDMDNLNRRITGSKGDFFVLTLLRALPIIPSSIISIGSGVLKIPLRIFILSTVVGSLIRDGFFIYVGYSGASILQVLVKNSEDIESLVQIIIILGILLALSYLYLKRKRPTGQSLEVSETVLQNKK